MVSKAFYQYMLEEKKKAVQDLNLLSPDWKLKTLPTTLLRPAFPHGNFPLLIFFQCTLGFLTKGVGAMLFLRCPGERWSDSFIGYASELYKRPCPYLRCSSTSRRAFLNFSEYRTIINAWFPSSIVPPDRSERDLLSSSSASFASV